MARHNKNAHLLSKFFPLLLVWLPFVNAISQYLPGHVSTPEPGLLEHELEKAHRKLNPAHATSSASEWIDVTYYRLQLDVIPQSSNLKGRVNIVGLCTQQNVGPLVLDLMDVMKVDSVWLNNQPASFVQSKASLSIILDRPSITGEMISVEVFYGGTPLATGFGSFIFWSRAGQPWVWSLSEPYGAKDWWPCKDDPSDKADSADILVTCDSTLKVGSQGILVSVVNQGNGRSTYHWRERYPIASYLISIAVADYEVFSNWFRYSDTDSMEILNFVLPENYTTALSTLPRTVEMLSIFSNLFGLYPFIQEKYGHAEFGSGGAMEHQTMTSTTTFHEDVIAHELAHQWFGDMITCRTWSDLWLNEGFAQYSTALYREVKYGTNSYRDYMNNQMSLAVKATGMIGVADTSSVRNLFDGNRIYAKGATVLHMLRHVLGDSIFFASLRVYANHPALKYATASIRDFQLVCEGISGKNLEYFFQQWIFGEGYPTYDYSWSAELKGNSYIVTVNFEQSSRISAPQFFVMPIDFRVSGEGWDTTFTYFNTSSKGQFTLNVGKKPSEVLLDPDGWILKQAFSDKDRPPSSIYLEQNFPNPFNPKTTIRFQVSKRDFIKLIVFDVFGRQISALVNEEKQAGSYEVEWNGSGYTSGTYYCRLQAGDQMKVQKMLLIK